MEPQISSTRCPSQPEEDGETKAQFPAKRSKNTIPKPAQNGHDTTQKGHKFEPIDLENSPPIDSGLPEEVWSIIQAAPANFSPEFFLETSRDLLENPNLTASYLSRAELSYTSFNDASFNPLAQNPHDLAKIIKHLKTDHQPLLVPGGVPGYELQWTVVRKLIPRNPKLDEPLLQTCHLYTSASPIKTVDSDGNPQETPAERNLVIYLPHATGPESIPFYHPKVRGVAYLYTYLSAVPTTTTTAPGTLSLYYHLFPAKPLDNRLTRTALKMLEILHKHSRGRSNGYQKRVHHDLIIPQKRFQDTYSYLKGKYAKGLMDGWVEQTPAEKHVFEDLGIAAFLIEVWVDMYGGDDSDSSDKGSGGQAPDLDEEHLELERRNRKLQKAQSAFPTFTDIGCGNGLLVSILRSEGWSGTGFDARARKTWSTFDAATQAHLKEMLLVPSILNPNSTTNDIADLGLATHTGLFAPGTFIISNHADELTLWTPLLAYLSDSPFIAIPCCSHNFGGTRFRAPYKHETSLHTLQPVSKGKMPSAYASLCSYIAFVTERVGFVVEKEFLRIPSTRNAAVLGRVVGKGPEGEKGLEEKMEVVRGIVEAEMGVGIGAVGEAWVGSAGGLTKERGGH